MLNELIHNNVPAPYMHHAMQPQMSPHMASGGRNKKSKMILAHFNRGELDELDHLQGKRNEDHTSGIRKYDKLEALLENPHLMKKISHHAREHHLAMGGHPMSHTIEQMKHDGRFGDTEMAMIGPRTEHILNHYCGGGSTNPYDGKHEYFLGALLGGLGQSLIPGLTRGLGGFAKGLTNWDSSKGFGANLGNAALGGLKSAFTSTDEQGNESLPSPQQVAQSVGNGANAFMNARQQGQGFGDSAMQGAQAGMQGYNSPVAKFGQGMLNSRQGGQSWGDSAMRGGHDAMEGMQNPMMRGARSAIGSRMQGNDMGTAGMRGALEATRGVDNPLMRGARGVMGGRLAGQDWQQSMGRGMQGATRGLNSNNPATAAMRGMGHGMQNGQGFGRSAMQGAQAGMQQMQRRMPPPQPRYMPQQENHFNELPYADDDSYAA
jgi:hypothetical protein